MNLLYITLIIITLLIYQDTLPMYLGKKLAGPLLLTGATAHMYYLKKTQDKAYADKELFWLSSATNYRTLPSIKDSLPIADHSPSYHHLVALHHATWPEKSEFLSLKTKTHDILRHYYSNGLWQLPPEEKDKLHNALVLLMHEESSTADDYYTFYHGTDEMPAVLFRTMVHEKIYPGSCQNFFVLRNPDIKSPFQPDENIIEHFRHKKETEKKRLRAEFASKYGKENPFEHVGQLFGSSTGRSDALHHLKTTNLPDEYRTFMLSVNRAALANSSPVIQKGSNSFRFLTDIPIYNDILSSLIPENKTVKREHHIHEIEKTIVSYGYDPAIITEYKDDLAKLCGNVKGMLIILHIPKHHAKNIAICESFNNPICSADQQLERMQQPLDATSISEIDSRHMVLPLDLFNDPHQGTKMHAIIRTDESMHTQLIMTFDSIIQKMNKGNDYEK